MVRRREGEDREKGRNVQEWRRKNKGGGRGGGVNVEWTGREKERMWRGVQACTGV